MDTTLARLRFELRLRDVLPLADAALAAPGVAGQDRCTALFLKADALAASGRRQQALAPLREMTQLRRHSVDWLLLADCEGGAGHNAAQVEALATAARINPRLWKVHQYLAEHYHGAGDADRAGWHGRRAVP